MRRLKVWTNRVFIGGLGPTISFASRFAGNVVLSRLLIPEEFGAAIAISTVIGLGGLVTDVALDRFVVIDGSAQALSTGHTLSIINSVLLAFALVISAPVAANLFGVPEFAGSFALAAGLSAVRGFAHLGVKQIQRDYDYRAETVAQVGANMAGIAALYLAAIIMRDHRAIIVGLTTPLAVYVILSHLLARTAYRLGWNKIVLRRALSFGLPLMLNGVGLAIMYQLDRVLVGYWLGVKALATYAVLFSMSVVPTNLILSVLGAPSLSYLLAGGSAKSAQAERYCLLLGLYSIVASTYALWMVLTLDVATRIIFGPSFPVDPSVHVLFTIIACLRLQRGGAPTTFYLASGQTGPLAVLNLLSGLGLAIALVCMATWPRLESMLVGIAVGEVISFTLFFTLLEREIARKSNALIEFGSAVALPAILAGVLASIPDSTWESRSVLLAVGLAALAVQATLLLHNNRKLRDFVFLRSG